jgi:SAM-dependent methyltransferase
MKSGLRRAGAKGWSALDLAEGFHLACALLALERLGVLASLDRPVAAGDLARKHKIDRRMLEATLRLVAARTNLVACTGGRYRTTRHYDVFARFMLRQYVGAYGGNAVALHRSVRAPSMAAQLIDRAEHAKAFGEAATLSSAIVADLIVQLGLNHVLDLGCGTGIMLRDLAARVPGFAGWGLDVNPSMCAAARERASAAPAGRIRILCGDCRDPQGTMPASIVAKVHTITACNLANEFFADGTATAATWLSMLKRAFPGRTLLIADYYGCLGKRPEPWPRHVALHDFVQVISGQGVPPSSLGEWKRTYRAARCTLIHAIEYRGAASFVHILRL